MLGSQPMTSQDPDQSRDDTRQLRAEYRHLISQSESERRILVTSETSKLTERVEQANVLFSKVKSTHEATVRGF